MRKSSGFTLIELVAGLILIAVVAAVAIPADPGRTLDGRAQAEQLASDIRYVQALSMAQGQRICLSLTSTGYRFATAGSGCTSSSGVAHPAGLAFPVAIRDATLSWTQLPNNFVVFSSEGVPYTDASATPALLSGNAVITFSGADGPCLDSSGKPVPCTVTISPTTGRVIAGP